MLGKTLCLQDMRPHPALAVVHVRN